LGVRDDDAAIEAMMHPEGSPFARFGPSGSGVVGGHDHGFLHDPVLRRAELPPALEQPEGWIGEARLWRRAEALACRLGYADGGFAHASVPTPRTRLGSWPSTPIAIPPLSADFCRACRRR